MKKNLENHWDKVYASSEISRLGWYEKNPEQSFNLISKCNLGSDAVILDVGAGATTLTAKLISEGYKNLTVTDISRNALNILTAGLTEEQRLHVSCVVDDITNPQNIPADFKVDLWHDRTVLHFLCEKKQREGYLNTLKNVVKPEGYVIIAVFSLDGAKKCSGLDVINYDEKMIEDFLGDEFELIEYFNHIYIQPSGNERPFVYTMFRRIGK